MPSRLCDNYGCAYLRTSAKMNVHEVHAVTRHKQELLKAHEISRHADSLERIHEEQMRRVYAALDQRMKSAKRWGSVVAKIGEIKGSETTTDAAKQIASLVAGEREEENKPEVSRTYSTTYSFSSKSCSWDKIWMTRRRRQGLRFSSLLCHLLNTCPLRRQRRRKRMLHSRMR